MNNRNSEVIRVKTDCPYFDNIGNLCARIENGMVRCDEYSECEFKYIDALKEENAKLKERLNELKEYVVRVPFPEYIKETLLKMIGE